jgi:DNA processing protein
MFDTPDLVNSRERAAVLALAARRAVPWYRLAGMIEEAGSALAMLDELDAARPDQLFRVDDDALTLDQLEGHIHAWEHEGIHVVTVLDESYPVNLRMVHDRPATLFVRGALEDRDSRSVAVVGTRKATSAGLDAAREIAQQLVAEGYVVVSGLAAGIDTAAHTATLNAHGRTIAVIGTGLRHAFPRANAELQERIAHEAAVLSQFWPGQEARKWTFPERNAVMSGFARTTVVVEASHTSGARMQARLALEHGRPVFLLDSLMEHQWARKYAEYDGVYVVRDGDEIVSHLERLYSDQLVLS